MRKKTLTSSVSFPDDLKTFSVVYCSKPFALTCAIAVAASQCQTSYNIPTDRDDGNDDDDDDNEICNSSRKKRIIFF